MNFQVPQFTEIEDKIFGPLSFRQFLYLAGGAALGYIFYNFTFLPLFIRAIPVLAAVGLGFALAFYKINDRPMIYALESAFWYYLHGRLYLWRKDEVKPKAKPAETGATVASNLTKLSNSKLKDLSWSLDVNEKIK